jgi:hypothetical protein
MEIKDTVKLKGARVLKIKNITASSFVDKFHLVPSSSSLFLNSLDFPKEYCVS